MSATTFPRSNGNGTGFLMPGLVLLALSWLFLTAQTTPSAQTNSGIPKAFVVADDEADSMAETVTAISTIVKTLGFTPVPMTAHSTDALLNLALHGFNGGPVDFVTLDGSYGESPNSWRLPGARLGSGPEFASLLRTSGFKGPIFLTSFDPFGFSRKPGANLFAHMFDKLDLWREPLNFVKTFEFLK